jgi:hypothetical protein
MDLEGRAVELLAPEPADTDDNLPLEGMLANVEEAKPPRPAPTRKPSRTPLPGGGIWAMRVMVMAQRIAGGPISRRSRSRRRKRGRGSYAGGRVEAELTERAP